MIRFFAFYNTKTLLITDFAVDKVKKRHGHKFEIITSIKDKSSLDQVKPRILRQFPTFQVKEQLSPTVIFSQEIREKLRRKKLGTKKDVATKNKISQTMKGNGNFIGKRHKEDSKFKTSIKMRNNKNVVGKMWIYNPRTFKEMRIDKNEKIPEGFLKGRDPEVVEYFKS